MNGTYNSIFSYNGTAAQTLAGSITGGGWLIQNGPGPLILSGTNSFNGSIIINQSYLVIVSPSAFGLPVRLSPKQWRCAGRVRHQCVFGG